MITNKLPGFDAQKSLNTQNLHYQTIKNPQQKEEINPQFILPKPYICWWTSRLTTDKLM
jgi:hypothetical protein